MQYDYTREALYHPENKPAFEGLSPDLAFDPTEHGFSAINGWWLSNTSHLAYLDEPPLRAALNKVGLELVEFYDNNGTQGFLAKSHRYAILAFRGTQPDELRDIIQDVKAFPIDFDGGGKVHSGFKQALDHVWSQIKPRLEALEASGIPVWYTGHSLGAALATLAAARHPPAALFTFGSPRVGDRDFHKNISADVHRAVNGADLVTILPPPGPSYRHIGDLYFLTETAPLSKNPSKSWLRIAKVRAIVRYAARLPWFRKNWVKVRSLADHAIVNYTAGLWKELR